MSPEPTRPPSRGRQRGRGGGDPVRLGEVIGAVTGRLGLGRVDVVEVVFGRWEEIVGPSVAAHVRPHRLDGTTLIVHVDHPAWATQFRHLAPGILTRLQEVCGPQGAPEHLQVRVRK